MKTSRLFLLPALVLALAAAGCGGGSDKVPDDAVAVVDGQTVARSDFNALIDQARKSYKNQKREFPKAGSQEFQTLKNQAVQFLVQRVEFEQQAEDLDIEVTEKQVDARLEQIKKQYFGGDAKKYEKQLKDQGLSDKQVRADIRAQIVSEEIFNKVTKDAKVDDAAIAKFYEENKAQYSQPESREVRHILVKSRQQALDLAAQLKAGADFGELAEKFSQDTGSKANGGKLTVSKGQTVAPFDQTAFLLKNNDISGPVKTEFGYHLIQPLADAKPAKVTPLKEVKESIRQQLQQTKKNEAMTKWVDETGEEYSDRTRYRTGFAPPAQTTTGRTLGLTTGP
jgi:foldase protein PrsA